MRQRITFMGEDFWTAHLADGLNSRFPDQVTCRAVPLRGNRLAVATVLWRLLRDQVIVRVGFPPAMFALEEYDYLLLASRGGMRERLKRLLFRSRLGRGLRKAVLFMRTPCDAFERRRLVIDWTQRHTRLLRPRRRDFIYWIGTDVLHVGDAIQSRPGGRDYLALLAGVPRGRNVERPAGRVNSSDGPAVPASHRNLTVARHLTAELKEVGLASEFVPFPRQLARPSGALPPMPASFTVVSYVPASRFAFYGGDQILEAARRLPTVQFKIFSAKAPPTGHELPNVDYLGYVEDMKALYEGCSVLLRMTEHDGSPTTVAEVLLFGRRVIHTYQMPHCIYVPYGDVDSLIRSIAELHELHLRGCLPTDSSAAAWAATEYDENRCYSGLLETLIGRRAEEH